MITESSQDLGQQHHRWLVQQTTSRGLSSLRRIGMAAQRRNGNSDAAAALESACWTPGMLRRLVRTTRKRHN
ncbi:hypothetical protein NL676_011115 [Syzygium grande]|nr:hypothetical protein NL676_011115 [Syzygium grande]